MKKSVLAIAVGAALATAGAAQAEVTIFAKAHLSFDMINAADKDPANAGDNSSSMYVSSNSSQLGFKEEEDLGDGMKAGLFMDNDVTMDSASTSTVFGRQTYAYLSGGFGNFTIGKVESPMKLLGRKGDFFGDQIGDTRNFTALSTGANATITAPNGTTTNKAPGVDQRVAGVLQYASPNMGGVVATIMYKPDEAGAVSTESNTVLDVGVNFTQGPLFVGFAYEADGKGVNFGTYASTDTTEAQTAMRLAASYAFGDATVAGQYQSVSNVAGNDGVDSTMYGIGGSFKVGAGAVKAQIFIANEFDCDAGCDKTGGTMFAIGYDHNLSKNTTVYAAYASVSNEDNGAWSAVGAGHGSQQTTAPVTGESSSGLSFGMIHKI